MSLEGEDRPMDTARSHPHGYPVKAQHQGDAGARGGGEPHPKRMLNLLVWLVLPFLLAMTMQVCGWMSLLGTRVLIVEDTRARIQADYSPWPFLSFLPVDPDILADISAETGRSINLNLQEASSQSFWGDGTSAPQMTATVEPCPTPESSETPMAGSPSPTSTPEGTAAASPTRTPLPSPTGTLPPTETETPPPSPTDDGQGNQYFNYTATPQPPEPTSPGNQGPGGDDQTDGDMRDK
jgi:hypothetical protein